MKTPDYMNYSRYKNKKKEDEPQKKLLIGLVTFFVMLLVFTGIAKSLSPDIDVSIGEDESIGAKESGLGVKKFIDDRLKMIQMEDSNQTTASKIVEEKQEVIEETYDDYSPELDEKVVLPRQDKKQVEEEPATIKSAQAPRPSSARPTEVQVTNKVTKVYVGYYNTVEQAKVAQGILIDSGLNITPFVKDMGGTFTLQVGSYSNRDKAKVLSDELLRNNFPARIVQE